MLYSVSHLCITSLKLVQEEVEGIGFAIPIEDAMEYANMIVEGMSGRNVEFEYGLERYKNMSKYGSDGVKHSIKEEPEDDFEEEDDNVNQDNGPDPELAQILEELEANVAQIILPLAC